MLIEMLIAASCAGATQHEACSKAVEAGTKQYGVYQNVDKAEDLTKKEAVHKVDDVAGAAPAAVVGFVAQGYHDKGFRYSFKPGDVLDVDKVTTQVGKGNGSLVFEWRF